MISGIMVILILTKGHYSEEIPSLHHKTIFVPSYKKLVAKLFWCKFL